MEKMREKLNNNSGMSLVEVVVVVLIMGIVTTVGVIGISQMNRMNSTGVAGKIESLLDRTRMNTISYDVVDGPAANQMRTFFRIKKESNGKYYGIIARNTNGTITELDRVELSDIGVSISYVKEDSGADVTTEVTTEKDFYFNKKDGSFDSADSKMRIVVSGSNPKTLYLVQTTGRTYIE